MADSPGRFFISFLFSSERCKSDDGKGGFALLTHKPEIIAHSNKSFATCMGNQMH
jgi:hypothetical protein